MSEPSFVTRCGFKWGAAHVQRIASSPKWGVILCIQSGKQQVEIRVTPSGMIRVGEIVKPVDYEAPE